MLSSGLKLPKPRAILPPAGCQGRFQTADCHTV